MNKKEKIVQTAYALFVTNGFDKTPTALIAKEAGVSTGTLFHYFATKEELINGLYADCKASMYKETSQSIEMEKSFKGKVRALFVNYVKWGLRHPGQYRFFQQFCNSPYYLESTLIQGQEQFEPLIGLFEAGIAEREIKIAELDYVLAIVKGILDANVDYFMDRPTEFENDAKVELAFSFLWESIR